MRSIPVVWWTGHETAPARGMWDQQLLEDLLARRLWWPANPASPHGYETVDADDLPFGEGAVVVVPGGQQDGPARLQEFIRRLPWVLLVVTSDEERRFDWKALDHPRMAVWVQYPRTTDSGANGYLPVGYPPGTPARAAYHASVDSRFHPWAFMGQITHRRRIEAARAMREVGGGLLLGTDGFGLGMPHEAYMSELGSTKVAVCPGGPLCPDSFRVWEALEAGCVPIVDREAGERNGHGYWRMLLGERPPWPTVSDWSTFGQHAERLAAGWPHTGSLASAWWQGYKRELAYRFEEAVKALAVPPPAAPDLADLITVVVPTSPIPSHPSLEILTRTLAALGEAGLERCEVIVTADGVRAEQADRAEAYHRAVYELVQLCEHEWPQVLPVVHSHHEHQARMMRHALPLVRTPLVLYVEHDCALDGGIDWLRTANLLLSGEANLVRFHHEAQVLDVHRHLMVGGEPIVPEGMGGFGVWPTVQWSQRPHLARVDYYERILGEFFHPDERHMIEDRMHSVVESAWLDRGVDGWAEHRLFIYHPAEGSIRRHVHLDGRGDDPKWTDR